MAYTKRKSTTKRKPRRKTTSSTRTTPARRRRTTRKKKNGLSEFFTNAQAKNSMSNMANGAAGAALYYLYNEKVTFASETPEKRAAIAAAGAFILGATLGKPSMAAGVMGAAAFKYFDEKEFLSESMDTEMARMNYVDEQKFYSQLPETLSENDMYALAENDDLYLAEADYLPNYYQSY